MPAIVRHAACPAMREPPEVFQLTLLIKAALPPAEHGDAAFLSCRLHDAAAAALLLVSIDTPPIRPDELTDARRVIADARHPFAARADVPAADFRHLRSPHTLTLPR